MNRIQTDPICLVGKTIKAVYVHEAEHCLTFYHYLCIECTDGTRFRCGYFSTRGTFAGHPLVKTMENCKFYTPEDCAEETRRRVELKRQNDESRRLRDEAEFKSLAKRLGKEVE